MTNTNQEELKCLRCGRLIPDLLASYEDDFCSEECYDSYQEDIGESEMIMIDLED